MSQLIFCKTCKHGSARVDKYCNHPKEMIKTHDFYDDEIEFSKTMMEFKNKNNDCPDYEPYNKKRGAKGW